MKHAVEKPKQKISQQEFSSLLVWSLNGSQPHFVTCSPVSRIIVLKFEKLVRYWTFEVATLLKFTSDQIQDGELPHIFNLLFDLAKIWYIV